MNTKYKLLVISISALLSSTAFAQAAPFNPDAPVSIPSDSSSNVQVGTSQLAGTNVAPPSAGNVYERQVTPYLREISKRKVLLETRKLDAEIERTEAEILKIQRSKEATEQSQNNQGSQPQATTQPQGQVIAQGTVQLPQAPQAPVAQPSVQQISAEPVSNVRVLMILGYDSDLYAKISTGEQGGYVVRKGDILPDGRRVSNITSTYLEVTKAKNKKGSQRLYVSGPAPTTNNGMPIIANQPLTQSSAMGAGGIPLTMPGLSMAPTTIRMPASPQGQSAGQVNQVVQGGGQVQNQAPTVTQQLGITPLR